MASAMADVRNRSAAGTQPPEAEPDADAPVVEATTEDQDPRGMEAELADTDERLLRALAEQQNIRRQMQREREEAVRFAGSRLAEDLLDTLDNLRRAIESVPADASDQQAVKPLLAGVEATERNLLETLARHGVQKIDPFGSAFDPHHHHAIFQRPDATAAEGTVIEVLQPGYMLHGRLLRPAMVGVAVPG
jgi:molecular chaperone GrpE